MWIEYFLSTVCCLTVLCKRDVILNKGFKVVSVGHHVINSLLSKMQVIPRVTLQLVTESSEQTVPAGDKDDDYLKEVQVSTAGRMFQSKP